MRADETLFAPRINTTYLVTEAAVALMLIGAAAFATDSAFAVRHIHKKYDESINFTCK
jgi:hypothetical protein